MREKRKRIGRGMAGVAAIELSRGGFGRSFHCNRLPRGLGGLGSDPAATALEAKLPARDEGESLQEHSPRLKQAPAPHTLASGKAGSATQRTKQWMP